MSDASHGHEAAVDDAPGGTTVGAAGAPAAALAELESFADERLDLAAIRDRLATDSGPEYWRSLDELADTVEFQEFMRKEFPRHAAPLEASLDRRDFLRLMGASLALAGLSACARPGIPPEHVVPYVRAPEEMVPGRPLFYATAVPFGGYAEGVLAESHMGRPTRVDGNPDHPSSLGAAGPTTLGSVLSLYDPDRSRAIAQGGQPRTWEAFFAALQAALDDVGDGAGLRILTETVTGPTTASRLRSVLQRFPAARWHQWDPLHGDAAAEGARLAFGEDVATVYDFSQADVVLSLDADFTNRGPGRLRYAKDFARRRRVRTADDDMNRLWAVESTPTPTGSLADHRIGLAPADVASLAAHLAGAMGVAGAPQADLPPRVPSAWAEALLADLQGAGERAVVVAGHDQPPVVHALAHAMNDALGAVGTTVRYVDSPEALPGSHAAALADLAQEMHDGAVSVLIVIGANPAFTAPGALRFPEAMGRVPFVVHLGQAFDETAQLATWHVPQAHPLESWGDARGHDGSITIMQPLFSAFYGGVSDIELLAAVLGDAVPAGLSILRAAYEEQVDGDFDAFWRRALHQGVVPDSANGDVDVSVGAIDAGLPAPSEFVLHLLPDQGIADGRYANNGWLQELPRPFSTLTWDNAAILAPATAQALGVTTSDLVTVSAEGVGVTLPVWVQAGQTPGVVTVAMGFGRRAAGRVGTGVGVDVYPLLPADGSRFRAVSVTRAPGRYRLATTQKHHSLDGTGERRHIVRAGTLEQFRHDPEHPHFVHPVPHHYADIMPDWEYRSYQWGMVIDQTVCTGCQACVIACQTENNIPVVGKRQVLIGREMHWIRVDQYYRGGVDDPTFYNMPMTCMHCEKAPCEPVCPVAATVHDHEGLNVMVYNRCVGTRYCSNNCPYKVRRYNYLQFAELTTTQTELSLANNPDVTVRSRGIMEKCTYCIQRISSARIQANNEGRRIADGEVVAACQSACPTEAIVFGDLADPESVVARTKTSPLDYAPLEELNTVPRTTYLARVNNPHDALAGEVG